MSLLLEGVLADMSEIVGACYRALQRCTSLGRPDGTHSTVCGHVSLLSD